MVLKKLNIESMINKYFLWLAAYDGLTMYCSII